MRAVRTKLCALLLSVSALGVTGCGVDSILSATSKILGGQISQLTAGEIQVLNQTALDLLGSTFGVQGEPLTVAQAEAVSSFLKINDLNTIDDFTTIATEAENNPDAVQGLDELSTAFAGSEFENNEGEFDPDQLGNLLQSLLGGVGGGGGGGGGGSTGGNTSTTSGAF